MGATRCAGGVQIHGHLQYVDRVVEGVPLYVGGCHSLASLHTLISTKYRRGKQQCKDGECNKRELRRGK